MAEGKKVWREMNFAKKVGYSNDKVGQMKIGRYVEKQQLFLYNLGNYFTLVIPAQYFRMICKDKSARACVCQGSNWNCSASCLFYPSIFASLMRPHFHQTTAKRNGRGDGN